MYGIHISAAKAKKLINTLPRIGYEILIKTVNDNKLYLSNISGDYYLKCFSIPDHNLLEYFNIK